MKHRVSAIFILVIAVNAFAIDVRQPQALDAKSLGLPPLAPNFDTAKAQLYLANPLWVAFNQSNGGNWFAQYDTLTGHPRRVLGGAIPWLQANSTTTDVERAARDFIAANNSVLGVSNDRLRFVTDAATPSRDGRIRFAAFDYVINGVPVENARLVFAVNNGNMIYWHSSNIADVPAITTPLVSASQALAKLLAYAGVVSSSVTVIQQPSLKLIPRNRLAGQLITYQLVYEALFRINGGEATWAAYIDALTGTVIAFGDNNEYASCPTRTATTGRVIGGIRPAQSTDAEVIRSFPFAAVETGDGTVATTNDGTYNFSGVSAATRLNGRFFDTNCVDCLKSEVDPQSGFQPLAASTNGIINLGTGGRDVVHGAGQPTDSYGNGTSTPADRTAFFHTNIARQIALKWLQLPWLLNATIPVKVNINDVCNAFWDGSALNFFKSGVLARSTGDLVCANTGEIRDVMQHEWGHGLDSNDGRPPATRSDSAISPPAKQRRITSRSSSITTRASASRSTTASADHSSPIPTRMPFATATACATSTSSAPRTARSASRTSRRSAVVRRSRRRRRPRRSTSDRCSTRDIAKARSGGRPTGIS